MTDPQMVCSVSFNEDTSEVIRIDQQGFHYRGQFIEDAGEAYQLLVQFLRKHQPDRQWGHLADTHYEWELVDAEGEWQAGGSSNSQDDVEREGMRYLQTYAQDGPHKLIIRQHITQTINEINNG